MPLDSEQRLFEHEPLDKGRASFRLLTLLPSSSDGIIRCSLRHASLLSEERPVYAAVSYAWGPKETVTSMKRILVNGKEFPVRQNLWFFLDRLSANVSKGHEIEDLWIDAICIDQNTLHERNHQVRLMKTIY